MNQVGEKNVFKLCVKVDKIILCRLEKKDYLSISLHLDHFGMSEVAYGLIIEFTFTTWWIRSVYFLYKKYSNILIYFLIEK